MTEQELRLECLKLARNDGHNTIEETVKVACTYAAFVLGATHKPSEFTKRAEASLHYFQAFNEVIHDLQVRLGYAESWLTENQEYQRSVSQTKKSPSKASDGSYPPSTRDSGRKGRDIQQPTDREMLDQDS